MAKGVLGNDPFKRGAASRPAENASPGGEAKASAADEVTAKKKPGNGGPVSAKAGGKAANAKARGKKGAGKAKGGKTAAAGGGRKGAAPAHATSGVRAQPAGPAARPHTHTPAAQASAKARPMLSRSPWRPLRPRPVQQ